ncbi:MAG: transglycosylase SLT domain-containing protein [Nakamurella sp.]
MIVGIALIPLAAGSANALNAIPRATEMASASGAASVAAAAARTPGSFQTIAVSRVLDTGSRLGAPGPLAADQSIAVRVLGVGAVPASGVAAVVVRVTVTAPTAAGYILAYADGATRPHASSLNFAPGQTVSNLVVVPVGGDGKIRLVNGSSRGSVQLLAAVSGYYAAGQPSAAGAFRALPMRRVLDTRSGLGAAGPLRGASSLPVKMIGVAGVPTAGVSAVVVNMTVTAPSASGYIAVAADGSPHRTASNVNFTAGQTVANLAVVPLGTDGKFSVFNGSGGSVQLIADVVGYYLTGRAKAAGTFQPVPASRVLDTRLGAAAAPLPAHASISVTAPGRAGLPASGVSSVILNVTVVGAAAAGYLSIYPDGGGTATGSVLPFAPGQTVANLAVVPVGPRGLIRVSNSSGRAVNLLVDVAGGYLTETGAAPCNALHSDPAGTAITRWNPITLCVLSLLRQSAGNLGDVNTIIEYESSGDPNAVNNTDINAQEGHPSEGLIQVIRPTFDQYRTPQLPNDLFNPAANLYAGLNYAIHTYGSIHNVPGLVSLRNGGGYVGYIAHR